MASRTPTESEPQEATWFAQAWPIVVFFHLAGNPGYLQALDTVALIQVLWLASACMFAVMHRRRGTAVIALPLMFALHACVYIMKAPWVGNHELLMLLVEFSGAIAVVTRRHRWEVDWATASRALLVVIYTAFAFSKLNADFFDRSVSCAVVFADELGLPVQSSSLSLAVIGLTVATELSIAVLLWFAKTREFGAIVGVIFHWFLALEPAGHVFDFSAVLFVLFGLCIPGVGEALRASVRASNISQTAVVAIGMVALAAQILVTVNQWTFWAVAWPLWIMASIGWVALLLTQARRRRNDRIATGLARAVDRKSIAWWVMIALAGLNALTPYVGLKSATSFNMYSNLRVTPGPSNHLIVPDAFALVDYPDSDVVLRSDDPLVQTVAGQRLPDLNLAMWAERISAGPTVTVQLATLSSEPFSVRAGIGSDQHRDETTLLQRLVVTRSVTADGPQKCRREFWPFL